jgi:hypothetical protein
VLVVVVALGPAVSGYQSFASIRLASLDVVGEALDWMIVFAVLAGAALLAFLLSLVALVVARPRGLAATALLGSLLLPVIATVMAVPLGVATFKANAAADITTHGGDAVHAVVRGLDRAHVDIGPLRDFLLGVRGSDALLQIRSRFAPDPHSLATVDRQERSTRASTKIASRHASQVGLRRTAAATARRPASTRCHRRRHPPGLSPPGCQVVVATHSPIPLALPGATILEIGEDGDLTRVNYDDALPCS